MSIINYFLRSYVYSKTKVYLNPQIVLDMGQTILNLKREYSNSERGLRIYWL